VQGACARSGSPGRLELVVLYVMVFPVWRLATRIPTRKMMSNPEVRGHTLYGVAPRRIAISQTLSAVQPAVRQSVLHTHVIARMVCGATDDGAHALARYTQNTRGIHTR